MQINVSSLILIINKIILRLTKTIWNVPNNSFELWNVFNHLISNKNTYKTVFQIVSKYKKILNTITVLNTFTQIIYHVRNI